MRSRNPGASRSIVLSVPVSSLAVGSIRLLYPQNRKVLAFVREAGDERVLVVANLSRNAQFVELELGEFAGMMPVELFGQTEFPRIGELPYFVTLGPYGFYWFELIDQDDDLLFSSDRAAARVSVFRCSDEQLLGQVPLAAEVPDRGAHGGCRHRRVQGGRRDAVPRLR